MFKNLESLVFKRDGVTKGAYIQKIAAILFGLLISLSSYGGKKNDPPGGDWPKVTISFSVQLEKTGPLLLVEVTPDGITKVYGPNRKALLSGKISQISFPKDLNRDLFEKLAPAGLKYLEVHIENFQDQKNLLTLVGQTDIVVFDGILNHPLLSIVKKKDSLLFLDLKFTPVSKLCGLVYKQKGSKINYESIIQNNEASNQLQPTAAENTKQFSHHIQDYNTYINHFEEEMNKLVSGQPEGIDLLLDIEKQNILTNGRRQTPEVGFYLGLPASGKDTLAESYIRVRFLVKHSKPNEDIEKHIFRYPIIKSKEALWTLSGSGTGYTGSEKISALNRFLVLHAGGRYRIVDSADGDSQHIEENPDWKPGQVLKGYYGPEDGVLFANEFHEWSQEMKSLALNEPLEKGFFPIGNPGEGVDRLIVPTNIIMASNDGIGLIAARDRHGKRVGPPLADDELMERWRMNSPNSTRLKDEIANPPPGNTAGGTPEKVLSRIPNARIVLLRPLTRAVKVSILKRKLTTLQSKFASKSDLSFPSLSLTFTPELIDFVTTYDQTSEEGARRFDDKIKTLIEKPLFDGLLSKTIPATNNMTLELGIHNNHDGTYSLVAAGKQIPIKETEKGRETMPISDQEIDRLANLEFQLNKRVKGVTSIVKALVRDIRLAANSERSIVPDEATKRADVYMFLGSSSTGKSELAVAVHQILNSTNSKPLVIRFDQIHSIEELKQKIHGYRDGLGQPVASDFMEQYDRANGKLVVVFDELTSGEPRLRQTLLTSLLEILREPVAHGFSDNKPRPLGQVKILMNGNLGEEWYAGIPRDIPVDEQWDAARKIFEKAQRDEGYQRKFLTSHLTEAFVNRVGMHRIFFFGPHSAKTIREMIHNKLSEAVTSFSKPSKSKRTWNLRFETTEDYRKTVEAIETFGFKLWEQGASIVNYIDQVFIAAIHEALLTRKIPIGSEVVISKTQDKTRKAEAKEGSLVGFDLTLPNSGTVIPIELHGNTLVPSMRERPEDIRLTGFHEAGHEVVGHVLMGDKIQTDGLTILPGVAEIDGNWIQYLGLASSIQVEKYETTKEVVIAKLAILAAGEAGEQLTTRNSRHTAGKANDMERATRLAQTAILKWGLSEKWGRASIPDIQESQYVLALSQGKKRLLEVEVQSLLEEGRQLARKVLIANYDSLFIPIGTHLATRGNLSGVTLLRFYSQRANLLIHPNDTEKTNRSIKLFSERLKYEPAPSNLRDFEFYSFIPKPKSVVDLIALRKQMRAKELAEVNLSIDASLISSPHPTTLNLVGQNPKPRPSSVGLLRCETLLAREPLTSGF